MRMTLDTAQHFMRLVVNTMEKFPGNKLCIWLADFKNAFRQMHVRWQDLYTNGTMATKAEVVDAHAKAGVEVPAALCGHA